MGEEPQGADAIIQRHNDGVVASGELDSYPSPSLAEIAVAQGFKSCTSSTTEPRPPIFARPVIRWAPIVRPSYNISLPLFHGGQGNPHPLDATQKILSNDLVDYWTNFARNRTPNSPAHTLPNWPDYSRANDNVQSINTPAPKTVYGYGKRNDCAMWDEIVIYE